MNVNVNIKLSLLVSPKHDIKYQMTLKKMLGLACQAKDLKNVLKDS